MHARAPRDEIVPKLFDGIAERCHDTQARHRDSPQCHVSIGASNERSLYVAESPARRLSMYRTTSLTVSRSVGVSPVIFTLYRSSILNMSSSTLKESSPNVSKLASGMIRSRVTQ